MRSLRLSAGAGTSGIAAAMASIGAWQRATERRMSSNSDLHTADWQRRQIHADLCISPLKAGNFVFSTGSIMFCGALPVNDFDSTVSRLLENVVRRWLA